ncbi:DNA-directed RNA polymerase III subunit RPC8 [Tanacetum coccineum]
MFNLTKLEHTLSLSLKEAVKGELESLFFDKVIANLGLCISVYDIESIYGGFIFANEIGCTNLHKRKAREEAAKVLYHMKDRARVLTKTEDIPDIITTARALLMLKTPHALNSLSCLPSCVCLKLLYALAVTRLDENTDIIWEMLDKALGKADGNQDILATTTWEKVPEATTLITPAECIKEFVEEERSKLSFNGFQYGVIIHEYLKTKDRRSLQ